MSYKIDLSKSENLNNKVMSEKETRRRLLQHAREVGCEGDMIKILDKYDNLLRNCTNEKERKDISSLGAYEVYRLLGGGGELYVNGQLVAKDD
jgi:hypothetical protein